MLRGTVQVQKEGVMEQRMPSSHMPLCQRHLVIATELAERGGVEGGLLVKV